MESKYPTQIFNGKRYYRNQKGYYKAEYKAIEGTRYMHRDVWVHTHGEIPAGHHIHHKDHNPANNTLENLACIHGKEHAKQHMAERAVADPTFWHASLAKARLAAPAWHKSAEGRAWHKQHAIQIASKPDPETRTCTWCNKQYVGRRNRGEKNFCGMSCQGMARKASGVDDTTRVCVICKKVFMVNRYLKKQTCGKACWKIHLGNVKRGL